MNLPDSADNSRVFADANIILYALNLAVARRLNLEQIASADQAFNRVQGVIVYQPEDVAS